MPDVDDLCLDIPGFPPDGAKGKLGIYPRGESHIISKKPTNEEGQELISAAQDVLENLNS